MDGVFSEKRPQRNQLIFNRSQFLSVRFYTDLPSTLIARLKMLFVAAKIRFHDNRDQVSYSIHEQRAAGLSDFLQYLDRRRKEAA